MFVIFEWRVSSFQFQSSSACTTALSPEESLPVVRTEPLLRKFAALGKMLRPRTFCPYGLSEGVETEE